jgi:hypothetical protein
VSDVETIGVGGLYKLGQMVQTNLDIKANYVVNNRLNTTDSKTHEHH